MEGKILDNDEIARNFIKKYSKMIQQYYIINDDILWTFSDNLVLCECRFNNKDKIYINTTFDDNETYILIKDQLKYSRRIKKIK